MDTFSIDMLVSIIACGLGSLAWLYGIWCHRELARQRRGYDEKIAQLEKQLTIVTSGSVGLGQRIMVLEDRVRGLQDQQDDLRQNDIDFSYIQAQKLIAQGVDAHTIAANSGLSPSEVSLMQLLYSNGNAA